MGDTHITGRHIGGGLVICVRGYTYHGGTHITATGVCGPLLETLTLFHTKRYDFPYPISVLTKNLIDGWRNNLRRAFVDGLIA